MIMTTQNPTQVHDHISTNLHYKLILFEMLIQLNPTLKRSPSTFSFTLNVPRIKIRMHGRIMDVIAYPTVTSSQVSITQRPGRFHRPLLSDENVVLQQGTARLRLLQYCPYCLFSGMQLQRECSKILSRNILEQRKQSMQKFCCECDFDAALCVADNLNTKNDWKWTDWLDSRRGRCTQNSGTVPACPDGVTNSKILMQHLVVILYIFLVCSGHGIIDGSGKDSFCLCFPDWQVTCCDQPVCGWKGE